MAVLGGWFYLEIAGGIQVSKTADDLYSDQLEAWLRGHTYLSYTPNPALASLSNPYDGRLNRMYRVLDLCYYHGRYYSYFGVTPIVLLGLPWHLITGTFLRQQSMVGLFVYGSLLLSLYLLYEIWTRYLRGVPLTLVAAASLVFTFGNLGLLHLLTPSFYQVAQSGANFCQLCSLVACLMALKQRRAGRFCLAIAGLAAGLAVASRPSFIFGGLALIPICFWVGRPRHREPSHRDWSRVLTNLAIAASPAALICGGILAYNWVRFDSPFEFGSSYVLAGIDQRGMVLVSARYLARNSAAFFLNHPETFHYFPFYRIPVKPTGLIYFPFLAGAGAVTFAWGARFRQQGAELKTFGAALLMATIGIFGFLEIYVESWLRYEVDFYVPAALTAAVGWLMLYDRASHSWTRAVTATAEIVLSTITITNVLLLAAAGCEPSKLEATARTANRIIGRIDALNGGIYGPVRLTLRLPTATIPEPVRLVSTGPRAADWIYLESAADRRIRLGYFHSGVGGPASEWIDPGRGDIHTLEVMMGSLLPAENQAYFDGWSVADIYRAKHLLTLSWDGNEILRGDCDFYSSGPNEVGIGADPSARSRDASNRSLIVSSQREAFDRALLKAGVTVYRGYARVEIRFPNVRLDTVEPLLAIGTVHGGDLLFVHYLADGRLRFGIDSPGIGSVESDPIKTDPSTPHVLYLHMGNLEPGARAGHALVILLDNQTVLETRRRFHTTAAEGIFWGLNAVNSSTASGMFSGSFGRISAMSRRTLSAAIKLLGPRLSGRSMAGSHS